MKRLTREKVEKAGKLTAAALRDPRIPKDGAFRPAQKVPGGAGKNEPSKT